MIVSKTNNYGNFQNYEVEKIEYASGKEYGETADLMMEIIFKNGLTVNVAKFVRENFI